MMRVYFEVFAIISLGRSCVVRASRIGDEIILDDTGADDL